MSKHHKTAVPIDVWQRVLRDDRSLPEPLLSETRAVYVADIATAVAVLERLERHAGEPGVDRAIQMVRFPLEARLSK